MVDDDHVRGVRPRWPALTRTTLHLVPALVSDVEADVPRVHSPRHLQLLDSLHDATDWASRALHACLDHLLTSTVTEASCVRVVDAWTDDELGLCLVYRPPMDEGRVVGLRRRRRDAVDPSDWRIGDMTTWGYDLGTDRDGDPVDAGRFGWNVADFDLGEPLGYVTTVLRYDAADIGWWGNLDDRLPTPPGL